MYHLIHLVDYLLKPILLRTKRKCIFWLVWKARNGFVFRDYVLSIQKLKFSFVNLLWSETKLLEDDPKTLVQFFDWVGVS